MLGGLGEAKEHFQITMLWLVGIDRSRRELVRKILHVVELGLIIINTYMCETSAHICGQLK